MIHVRAGVGLWVESKPSTHRKKRDTGHTKQEEAGLVNCRKEGNQPRRHTVRQVRRGHASGGRRPSVSGTAGLRRSCLIMIRCKDSRTPRTSVDNTQQGQALKHSQFTSTPPTFLVLTHLESSEWTFWHLVSTALLLAPI